jgi:hypothetical protein
LRTRIALGSGDRGHRQNQHPQDNEPFHSRTSTIQNPSELRSSFIGKLYPTPSDVNESRIVYDCAKRAGKVFVVMVMRA